MPAAGDGRSFANGRLGMARRVTTVPCGSAFSILFQNAFERQSLYERPPTFKTRLSCPVAPCCRPSSEFACSAFLFNQAEMARHYVLSPEDLALVRAKRLRAQARRRTWFSPPSNSLKALNRDGTRVC